MHRDVDPDHENLEVEKQRSKSVLEVLGEWKTQLAAMAIAPFVGIGFVFDFLLRAKDFPELASAMWGMFGFFFGLFMFFISLTCAALAAVALGTSERELRTSRLPRTFALWMTRFLAAIACLSLLFIAYWSLARSSVGFSTFVAPYVEWLQEQN